MSGVSVAEAARRLGVNVSRVHQRIRDGSLRAERIGSQWVVDERSVLEVGEQQESGRPLSARSAWAIIATSEGDNAALRALAPSERARARARFATLLAQVAQRPSDEEGTRKTAVMLRSVFRNRAERRLFRAAPPDLDELRLDGRWLDLVDASSTGIASRDVEGYLRAHDVESLIRDFLLVPAIDRANVLVHLLPGDQKPYPGSKLQLAADLAEHRGPRQEARAAELLHQVAQERAAQ